MIATRNGRTKAPAPTVRVAVYCRQSVTEGHAQEFGSLDAQREAIEAYVASQRANGWEPLGERYDDGGYSGATTERPAFQRLLADIEAGKVDVVAVYRLDRLTRSILDFARLMQVFEAQGVAFVSVTESFETTTPMGRMVLHILATFAQFERETIAQRTRDKMLASRRRGLWTGGRPVLGYDVVEKKLVVNEREAEQVREIFALYLELGSLLAVAEELNARGWTTKTWTNEAGKLVHGHAFHKGSVHSLLTNPLYAGKVRAGGEVCDGAHEAIVDEDTWRTVQSVLASNAGKATARRGPRRKGSALLTGIARCACGAGMVHTYTAKGDKRYSYYICDRLNKEGAAACPGSRVSAGELEAFVIERLRGIGRDPAVLEATLAADRADREAKRPELEAEGRRLAAERKRLDEERRNLLEAIGQGGRAVPVLTRRLGEIDEELGEVQLREAEVRRDLTALERGRVGPGELRAALADLEPIWAELFPQERARMLSLLLEAVVFDAAAGEVELALRPGGPKAVRG